MSRGYGTVVTGGGDGTLMGFLNDSLEYADRSGDGELPVIGVLKLGTGNGIGSYVGADTYLQDLRRMIVSRPTRRQRMSLIEVEGRYCHFTGVGLDAAIVNDYAAYKDTWIGKRLQYAATVPAVSIPRQLTIRRKYPVAHIVNEGPPAYLIGEDGRPVGRPIQRGETIYRGPVLIVGAATMPYYGYGFKLYPYAARRPNRMQLRISWASTFETLSRLPWIWRGTYRSRKIRDYYCEKVRLTFDQEIPFQIGGDGVGTRREVTFTLSERSVELIDLARHDGLLAN
jgi:diacylglycerol kinase family enzyme